MSGLGQRSAWWPVLVAWLAFALPATAASLPTFQQVRAAHRPSDLTLQDRHGVPLQTLRTDAAVRRLDWLPLADVSPALLHAVVLSEDRRFYEHSGVDWSAVASSAWANLWNRHTRGASTLTMQLAGLIDEGLARPAAGRSLPQKIGQAVTARALEQSWSKAQILEAYLNSVPFRGEIVGLNALSFGLFGKHASGSIRMKRRWRRRCCARRMPTCAQSPAVPAACCRVSSSAASASRRWPSVHSRGGLRRCRRSNRWRRTSRATGCCPRALRSSAARWTPARSASRSRRCAASSRNCAAGRLPMVPCWCSTTRAAPCAPGWAAAAARIRPRRRWTTCLRGASRAPH